MSEICWLIDTNNVEAAVRLAYKPVQGETVRIDKDNILMGSVPEITNGTHKSLVVQITEDLGAQYKGSGLFPVFRYECP